VPSRAYTQEMGNNSIFGAKWPSGPLAPHHLGGNSPLGGDISQALSLLSWHNDAALG